MPFNEYFQDELLYLRTLTKEFAEAHPALAPMLSDRGADPDVERLLEGVAFLTGRIRQKLDDELPEIVFPLAMLLFPQLTCPLPGAAIVELYPKPHLLAGRQVVRRGTEFASVPVDGTRCRFRSVYDVEMVPWTIQAVRVEPLAGGRGQLCLDVEVPRDYDFAQGSPEQLRLHFAGDPRVALGLLQWLSRHAEEAVARHGPLGQEQEIVLADQPIAPVGYGDEDALLPIGSSQAFAFRSMVEYFMLPSKFAFVDVRGVGRLARLGKGVSRFTLAIRCDTRAPDLPAVSAENVKLHCTPVVNLFPATAEPIRVDRARGQYLVRPSGMSLDQGGVYSIERVTALTLGTGERIDVPSFFDGLDATARGTPNRMYYSTHMRPSLVGEDVDVSISIGGARGQAVPEEARVLSVDLMATNRRAASAVRVGEISVPTPSSPSFATFRNLGAVTTYVPPPFGQELLWRVVAHSAMNLRTLADADVLRTVLGVYNLHGLVDRQAARANQMRAEAVREVVVQGIERLYRGAPVRGVSIDVTCDEGAFSGDGDLFLFGSIVERIFAAYVSINSFSRTTVHAFKSKVSFSWPPRSGNQTLL